MPGTVISLCDLTGTFTKPWRDAGFEALHIDPQRPDNGTIMEMMPVIRNAVLSGQVRFIAGFFPCTDLTSAGSRWWKGKFSKDRYFQARAAMLAEQCRTISEISGAPYVLENPRGAASALLGKPDHFFHPYMYSALAPEDNYTKGTCLWAGNGYEHPEVSCLPEIYEAFEVAAKYIRTDFWNPRTKTEMMKKIKPDTTAGDYEFLELWYPDDRIHKASPGDDRANLRSATPAGYSKGAFQSNNPAPKAA